MSFANLDKIAVVNLRKKHSNGDIRGQALKGWVERRLASNKDIADISRLTHDEVMKKYTYLPVLESRFNVEFDTAYGSRTNGILVPDEGILADKYATRDWAAIRQAIKKIAKKLNLDPRIANIGKVGVRGLGTSLVEGAGAAIYDITFSQFPKKEGTVEYRAVIAPYEEMIDAAIGFAAYLNGLGNEEAKTHLALKFNGKMIGSRDPITQ